jgi:two-component sensor histidine kinase
MPAAQLRLTPAPASVGEARRMLRARLAEWGLDANDDVEMAATQALNELTTNALLHARTEFTVTLEYEDEVLRVCVEDGSVKLPAMRTYGTDATTGRGLAIVARLCRSWGSEKTDTGKRVWFEISTLADATTDDDTQLHLVSSSGSDDAPAPKLSAGPWARTTVLAA